MQFCLYLFIKIGYNKTGPSASKARNTKKA